MEFRRLSVALRADTANFRLGGILRSSAHARDGHCGPPGDVVAELHKRASSPAFSATNCFVLETGAQPTLATCRTVRLGQWMLWLCNDRRARQTSSLLDQTQVTVESAQAQVICQSSGVLSGHCQYRSDAISVKLKRSAMPRYERFDIRDVRSDQPDRIQCPMRGLGKSCGSWRSPI